MSLLGARDPSLGGGLAKGDSILVHGHARWLSLKYCSAVVVLHTWLSNVFSLLIRAEHMNGKRLRGRASLMSVPMRFWFQSNDIVEFCIRNGNDTSAISSLLMYCMFAMPNLSIMRHGPISGPTIYSANLHNANLKVVESARTWWPVAAMFSLFIFQ